MYKQIIKFFLLFSYNRRKQSVKMRLLNNLKIKFKGKSTRFKIFKNINQNKIYLINNKIMINSTIKNSLILYKEKEQFKEVIFFNQEIL